MASDETEGTAEAHEHSGTVSYPYSLDWREKGLVSPVRLTLIPSTLYCKQAHTCKHMHTGQNNYSKLQTHRTAWQTALMSSRRFDVTELSAGESVKCPQFRGWLICMKQMAFGSFLEGRCSFI